METRKNVLRGSVRKSVLLLVLLGVLIICPHALLADGTNVKEVKRLEKVSSALEALEAERAKLLEEKEDLQILLWGEIQEDEESDEFLDMSIVDLMQVEVEPVGTLTKTKSSRYIPGAVTTITKEQIFKAGAHSLDELLEIYVPNLELARQDWEPTALGLRGIINDRDDKWLLLVNGRVMNERQHYGALSERDLPLLADIHHIAIVRGPGSAIYGPGAIAGVVNIVIENAMTFKGMEVTAKLGAIEKFSSLEFKYGRRFSKDSGAYFYFGIDKYAGSNKKDSPFAIGQAITTYGGNYTVPKGENVSFTLPRDQQAYSESPRVKFHGEFTIGNLDIWARYTRGGVDQTNQWQAYTNPEGIGTWGPEWDVVAENQTPSGTGYQQFTVYAKYKQEISETADIEYVLSYDTFRYIRRDFSYNFNRNDEDEFFAKVLGKWVPNDEHSLAIGASLSWESFNAMTGGTTTPGKLIRDSGITNDGTPTHGQEWVSGNGVFVMS